MLTMLMARRGCLASLLALPVSFELPALAEVYDGLDRATDAVRLRENILSQLVNCFLLT